MKNNLQPDRIQLSTFKRLLARYNDLVPKQLAELEELRLHTIPEAIAERARTASEEGAHAHAYLEKDELRSLVEWKLKHGTFRPNLLKLATSNPTDDIKSTSITAFSTCPRNTAIPDASPASSSDLNRSIATLTKLRGIGPSTASLILSCYSPDTIPFFSDELFRYMHWGETVAKSHGDGWSRKIKYTPAEYRSLVEKVWQWRSKIEKEKDELVRVIDLEKVAYVLGKGAEDGYDIVDSDGYDDDDDDDDDDDNGDKEEEKVEKGNGAEKSVQLGEDDLQIEAGTKKRKAQARAMKSRKRHEA